MFLKNKEKAKLDPEQREMFEYARHRIKQKKNLFRHFIIFLAGAVLLIILNLLLNFGEDFRPFQVDWFVWAILIWFFFFLIHFLNVFVMGRFMDKKWENEQMDKLVAKQKNKIAEMQKTVEKENPLPEKTRPFKNPDQPHNT